MFLVIHLKWYPVTLHWRNHALFLCILHGAKCILHRVKESLLPERLLFWEEKSFAAILLWKAIKKKVKWWHKCKFCYMNCINDHEIWVSFDMSPFQTYSANNVEYFWRVAKSNARIWLPVLVLTSRLVCWYHKWRYRNVIFAITL